MNYLDFHADTLTEIENGTLQYNHNNIDLNRVWQICRRYAQVFAIWKDPKQVKDKKKEFKQLYQKAIRLLKEADTFIELCLSFQDMERALEKGKAAAFLAIEDISLMGSQVTRMKELGFRFAMLTWNYENEYAYGATFDQTKGLKAEGKRVVKQLIEEGIILDISHLSDAGADDIFGLTDRPVLASHSNVRDICGQPRNLCRMHIQEIIDRKGIIGMNLYRPFICDTGQATVTDLFRHMDYILEMGGTDVLVLGCDFDGCNGLFPNQIKGVESVSVLYDEMKRAGFGEKIIEKIFFENGYQFIKMNLKGDSQ